LAITLWDTAILFSHVVAPPQRGLSHSFVVAPSEINKIACVASEINIGIGVKSESYNNSGVLKRANPDSKDPAPEKLVYIPEAFHRLHPEKLEKSGRWQCCREFGACF